MPVYRRYTKQDIPDILNHVYTFLKLSKLDAKDYSRTKLQDTLIGNLNSKSFFCDLAIKEGKIIGGMCGTICSSIYSHQVFASDHLLFILPEHRKSLRTVTALVARYETWAIERGVKAIRLAQTSGNKSQQYNKLAKYLGYTQIGSIHQKEV